MTIQEVASQAIEKAKKSGKSVPFEFSGVWGCVSGNDSVEAVVEAYQRRCPMKDKAFQYISNHGTIFECSKCDFSTPIVVFGNASTKNKGLLVLDVAEMIGYHAVNIRPELNGFAGYDCLRFEYKK